MGEVSRTYEVLIVTWWVINFLNKSRKRCGIDAECAIRSREKRFMSKFETARRIISRTENCIKKGILSNALLS